MLPGGTGQGRAGALIQVGLLMAQQSLVILRDTHEESPPLVTAVAPTSPPKATLEFNPRSRHHQVEPGEGIGSDEVSGTPPSEWEEPVTE